MKNSESLFAGMLVVSLLFLTLPVAISCRTSEGSPSVTIEFAPGYPADAVAAEKFDETGSVVVRSMSFSVSDTGITLSPSKSKDAKITTLVFVGSADSGSLAPVACVPVTGKEYEFDMSKAKFYTVSSESAREIASVYGIIYETWQTGLASDSDKFPCCQ